MEASLSIASFVLPSQAIVAQHFNFSHIFHKNFNVNCIVWRRNHVNKFAWNEKIFAFVGEGFRLRKQFIYKNFSCIASVIERLNGTSSPDAINSILQFIPIKKFHFIPFCSRVGVMDAGGGKRTTPPFRFSDSFIFLLAPIPASFIISNKYLLREKCGTDAAKFKLDLFCFF